MGMLWRLSCQCGCFLLLLPNLQERSSVKGKSLEQLGDWQQPLSAAHEVRHCILGLAVPRMLTGHMVRQQSGLQETAVKVVRVLVN